MASSLNTKRMFLMMIAAVGLLAAVVCIVVLATGVREATRERLFLVGSLLIVSIVCLALSIHFKDTTQKLDEAGAASAAASEDGEAAAGAAKGAVKGTGVKSASAKNAAQPEAEQDPDDVALPQNGPAAGGYGAGNVRQAHATPVVAEEDPDDVHLPQNDA